MMRTITRVCLRTILFLISLIPCMTVLQFITDNVPAPVLSAAVVLYAVWAVLAAVAGIVAFATHSSGVMDEELSAFFGDVSNSVYSLARRG